MVFNSLMVLSVARISAETWQQIACIRLQDRVSSQQLLDLVCCFPLQQLGRFALYIWTILCLPPPDSFLSYSYNYSTLSSSDDDDDDDDDEDQPDHHLRQHGHHNHLQYSSSSSSSSCSAAHLNHYYYDSD